MYKIIIILILLQSCIGAGDIFARREKIKGNYYLIESESGGYTIGYQVDEGYIGRSPRSTKVLAYAIKDSLLIMHVQYHDSADNYYVLNMATDSDYSDEEEYHIETIASKDFKNSWIYKQNLSFKPVED